jgi:hypothetical protein
MKKIPIQLHEARSIAVTDIESFDQACEVARKLESLHDGMEASNLEIRFYLGRVISVIGTERGKGTVDMMAEKTGISSTTLRIARRFSDHFNGDVERMRQWVRNHKHNGHKVNWQAVIDLTRANRDAKVLGPEKMIRRLVGSVERSVRDLEAANEAISLLPESEQTDWKDQLIGAATKLYEESSEFRNHSVPVIEEGGTLFFRPIRSTEYLEWIRTMPCVITGSFPVDAHHAVGKHGRGEKASDFGVIPLARELHMEYHDKGREYFENKYNVDITELVLNYLHRYITGQWLTLTHLPTP